MLTLYVFHFLLDTDPNPVPVPLKQKFRSYNNVPCRTSSKCCCWLSSSWYQLGSSFSRPNVKAFWLVLSRISAPITEHRDGRITNVASVADPGCLSRIPDPNCLHPESRIRIEELKYFNPKKWFLSSKKNMIWVVHPASRIRMLTFYPSRIPDPGVKKMTPNPGSATLNVAEPDP